MLERQDILHRFPHEAMATVFEVIIRGEELTYARQAAQAVFQEVDRLEGLLSRFRRSSDLWRVNRLQPGQSVRVTVELFECLRIARQVYDKTAGAFDVTIGSLMRILHDEEGRPVAAGAERRVDALSRVGMKRLELDEENLAVSLAPAPGKDQRGSVELDLGGIGKGYALDRCAEILDEWGIGSALINAGTSTVLAIGEGPAMGGVSPAGKVGWIVGAGAEWERSAGFGTLRLENEALSGSGKRVKGEHILDPRTGFPIRGNLAAWAVAPTAAEADALSTAFMVMSPVEIRDFCRLNPGAAALVVVRRQGILGVFQEEAIPTAGFRSRSLRAKATDT